MKKIKMLIWDGLIIGAVISMISWLVMELGFIDFTIQGTDIATALTFLVIIVSAIIARIGIERLKK